MLNHSIYDLKELTITELWPLYARKMNYLGPERHHSGIVRMAEF